MSFFRLADSEASSSAIEAPSLSRIMEMEGELFGSLELWK